MRARVCTRVRASVCACACVRECTFSSSFDNFPRFYPAIHLRLFIRGVRFSFPLFRALPRMSFVFHARFQFCAPQAWHDGRCANGSPNSYSSTMLSKQGKRCDCPFLCFSFSPLEGVEGAGCAFFFVYSTRLFRPAANTKKQKHERDLACDGS